MKMIKGPTERVEYIEITEERYNHVDTRFKYASHRGTEKHYFIAKNRNELEFNERDSSNRQRLDDWLEERK